MRILSAQEAAQEKTDRLYKFILQFMIRYAGLRPSIREMMAGADITSSSMVQYHLIRLETEGRIIRPEDGRSRAVSLPGSVWCPPAQDRQDLLVDVAYPPGGGGLPIGDVGRAVRQMETAVAVLYGGHLPAGMAARVEITLVPIAGAQEGNENEKQNKG